MKPYLIIGIVVILVISGMAGIASAVNCTETCEGSCDGETSACCICGESQVVDLIAGQNVDAGNITVWNNDTLLFVEYETSDGWNLSELHLMVAIKSEEDVCIAYKGGKKNPVCVEWAEGDWLWPQGISDDGTPNPGLFPYYKALCGGERAVFAIPLADIMVDCDDPESKEIAIAAHAVVRKETECITNILGYCECLCDIETAWGEGDPFNEEKSWAMYFNYTVQCCKCPDLPAAATIDVVKFVSTGASTPPYASDKSYFDINLTGFDPLGSYNIEEGAYYNGWCIDLATGIPVGDVNLNVIDLLCTNDESSLNTTETGGYINLQDGDWDLVNWIINNKVPDDTNRLAGSTWTADNWKEIQMVIWNFTQDAPVTGNIGGITPNQDVSLKIIADAQAFGEGYRPGPGDMVAVILLPELNDAQTKQDYQITIIEVDP